MCASGNPLKITCVIVRDRWINQRERERERPKFDNGERGREKKAREKKGREKKGREKKGREKKGRERTEIFERKRRVMKDQYRCI